ncbi:MAG TPA: acetyl ornithine aminotransferase family protein [Blastocatellia bacterium]|jgi:4-aminobutyrate aminotransferase|nr:acetyl ornithine aminotransferase family protein [Blastocatellia bacterium]
MQTLSKTRLPEIKTSLPGPNAKEFLEKDEMYISPSYTRSYPLVMKRGYGALIEDVDGNTFLDFNAGVAVAALGHAHPEIAEVIAAQAREFIHISGTDYYYPQQTQLAEKLNRITPGDFLKKVHYSNSGAEAMEGALKAAIYSTNRDKFIAFRGAFHGRTLGTLSLTASRSAQRRGFGPQALDVTHVPYANPIRFPLSLREGEGLGRRVARYIEETIFRTTVHPKDCAAIVVEPVQGEGGYVVPSEDFLPELRRICDENGIVLIVDEVQTGMGRTGKMWAVEHSGVVPDIICMAKAIGGGLPLGVTIARDDLMQWHVGAHASTFGGNPVAIAAAMKTIEIIENGVMDNAAAIGGHLLESLRELKERYDCIVDVRGLGLMIGIEFARDPEAVNPWPELRDNIVSECFNRGLVLQGAGESAIRFSPPLIIDREQADFAIETLEESIRVSL